jgi:hypothetical protein
VPSAGHVPRWPSPPDLFLPADDALRRFRGGGCAASLRPSAPAEEPVSTLFFFLPLAGVGVATLSPVTDRVVSGGRSDVASITAFSGSLAELVAVVLGRKLQLSSIR